MATLKSIKGRIVSVKNTQKITKAMKMVAAAKLRRAHEAVTGSRPYATKLRNVIVDVSSRASATASHPLFTVRAEVKNVEILIFTSNRGLCGSFNSALLRQNLPFIQGLRGRGVNVNLVVIGKKGRDFFQARKVPIAENIQRWADSLPFVDALAHTQKLMEKYTTGEIDEFYLIYNKFESALRQVPTTEKLLPIELPQPASLGSFILGETPLAEGKSYGVDFIYEPSKVEILNAILPKFMATLVFKSHLESLASELGARMSAMDSATSNASDMIGKLTLTYNRLRQAAITTELMDIVNGAESLK